MLRRELEQLLKQDPIIAEHDNKIVFENALGISYGRDLTGKRMDITLCLRKLDPPDLYPPLALSEMPQYVCEQRVIAERPYRVTLHNLEGSGEDKGFDFRDLETVDSFLQKHGKRLEDVELIPDIWEDFGEE